MQHALVLAEARRDPAMAERIRQWSAAQPEKDATTFQGWDLTTAEDGQ